MKKPKTNPPAAEVPPAKVEEVLPKPRQQLDPGMVSIAISESDLLTFANLMSIVTKTFESLAMEAATKDDAPTFKILQARWQLSNAFAIKLADCVKMPEPLSRDVH